MKFVKAFAQRDPSGTLSILSLVAAPIAALAGHPEFAPVFVAVAAAVLGLRTKVTPTGKAKEGIAVAAAEAATTVARDLDEVVVGTAGEVTDAARDVVSNAVDETVGTVLGRLGLK